MSNFYLKFLANNLFYKLAEIDTFKLIDRLLKTLKQSEIKFDINQHDLSSSLPLLCLKLIENDLIGLKVGSEKLINSLDSIGRPDLAAELKQFDEEHIMEIEKLCNQLDSCTYYETDPQTIKRTVSVHDEQIEVFFDPYKFQQSLALNGCKALNNIVCVRTGSGKTLIAALICKYWYHKFKNSNQLDSFKVAFIVPTRNLVHQQANVFKKAFDSDDLAQIDEKPNEIKIKKYFDSKKILFLTPQKLINTVQSDLLKISDFSILFFDECHHTNDNHPFNEIMKIYYMEKKIFQLKKCHW